MSSLLSPPERREAIRIARRAVKLRAKRLEAEGFELRGGDWYRRKGAKIPKGRRGAKKDLPIPPSILISIASVCLRDAEREIRACSPPWISSPFDPSRVFGCPRFGKIEAAARRRGEGIGEEGATLRQRRAEALKRGKEKRMSYDGKTPIFSMHAIDRARRRFPYLAPKEEAEIVRRLTRALVGGEVIEEEIAGKLERVGNRLRWIGSIEAEVVRVRGEVWLGKADFAPVEFVVSTADGTVITTIDPLVYDGE